MPVYEHELDDYIDHFRRGTAVDQLHTGTTKLNDGWLTPYIQKDQMIALIQKENQALTLRCPTSWIASFILTCRRRCRMPQVTMAYV